MRTIVLFVLTSFYLFAFEKTPESTLKASGLVTDIVYDQGELLASTGAGTVDIFDTDKKSLKRVITVPKIKDFMGDMMPAKVYSVDKLGDRVLLTVQGPKGYRELYMEKAGKLEKLIDVSARMFIKKAKFVDRDHVLIGLLSNELILYSIGEKKPLYRKQVRPSSFSDFALSEDRSEVVTADESGILNLIDVKSGETKRVMEGENLDNVYQVDYKNGIAAGAGQDRKVSVYTKRSASHVRGTFLIYSVALSPSATLCAFAANEKNEIAVMDVQSGGIKGYLKGHDATLSRILFIDEEHLVSSADERNILFWRLR